MCGDIHGQFYDLEVEVMNCKFIGFLWQTDFNGVIETQGGGLCKIDVHHSYLSLFMYIFVVGIVPDRRERSRHKLHLYGRLC